MVDRFVKQLDGCAYCSGGKNCTCACHAMWMYRATQGRVSLSACQVRRATGDTSGGTTLRQMASISAKRGITGGTLWLPGSFDRMRSLVLTGRHGAHCNIGYNVLANTQWDCFDGNFRGAHDLYIRGGSGDYAYYGDPGADGRRSSIPNGWQKIPWGILERAAGALPLVAGGPTLAQEYGSGRVFTYLTPADPAVKRLTMAITGYTPLYNAMNGTKVDAVSKATYVCDQTRDAAGLWWYRIVSKRDGSRTANAGRWFKPNRYTRLIPDA